jgi:hypothetical protein
MIRLLIGKLGTRRHVRLPIAGTHHNFRTRWNRSALAMVAVAVACGSYVLGASVTPSASGDIGNQLEFSGARGFDACELPKNLEYIYKHPEKFIRNRSRNYENKYIGFYVGGITIYNPEPEGCLRPRKGKINRLHALGWNFLPIMDGRQPPCGGETTYHFSDSPTDEYRAARRAAAEEADTAIIRMKQLGFGPKSIVYYDFETFDQIEGNPNPNPDPQCLAAAKAFINNWDRRLKEAYGAKSGFYGPVVGAHLKEFWNLNYKPDDLWFSEVQKREGPRFVENEEHQSVWDVPESRLPEEYWINRLHQWEVNGNYIADNGDETPIDLDCARGYIAGSGEDRPEPKCQAK